MKANFEYDPSKSASNKAKHGIDFEEAQALWDDTRLLITPTRFVSEERFVAIGPIGSKHWAVVYTIRGDAIRIISVRRARKNEVKRYESQ
ncbi:MAG TPA: BrnT family toxin [Rhodothermales bacterium]|nr:BrnT family toxin [Rhodothermales bacterium]